MAQQAEPGLTRQVRAAQATGRGLKLIVTDPDRRGWFGQIALHQCGTVFADLDVRLGGPCQVGLIEQVRVDSEHRRHGYARVLLAAALVRRTGYQWSTTTVENTSAARSFWAVASPVELELGHPQPCSDMVPDPSRATVPPPHVL